MGDDPHSKRMKRFIEGCEMLIPFCGCKDRDRKHYEDDDSEKDI